MKSLRFAGAPTVSPERLSSMYGPMAHGLSQALRLPVQFTPSTSYADLARRFEHGEADIIAAPPRIALQLHESHAVVCVAVAIENGSSSTSGYVLAKADSVWREADTVKRARVAFVDQSSTTGFLVPVATWNARGVDVLREAGKISFEGTHEAVVDAVLSGRADLGATNSSVFRDLVVSRRVNPQALRIVLKTVRVPLEAICTSARAPHALVAALRAYFLGLNQQHPADKEILARAGVNGYAPFEWSRYDELKETLAKTLPGP
jgi:phosphonate transport system substrate-binding protein